jgi:transcriptional regulator with XRE-family HTH domain
LILDDTTENNGWYSEEAATFGDRVAAAREILGVTQGELSRHLGVKEKTVAAWEDDRAEPRANKLAMLSGVLNVSMRWMLTGEGDGISGPEDGPQAAPDVTALLVELRELRGQASVLSERLGRVEKRLRAVLKDA